MAKRKMAQKLLALALTLATFGCAIKPAPKVHGTIKTSRQPYTSRIGFIPNKRSNLQTLTTVEAENVSAYVWTNQQPREIDTGLRYSRQLTENLSARTGLDMWSYPGKDNPLGTRDFATEAGLNWQLPYKFNLNATLTHVFNDSNTESGQMAHATLSRPIQFKTPGGLDAKLTPSLQTAYGRNYYSVSGHSQTTPGLSIRLTKPTKIGERPARRQLFFEAFLKHQIGNKKQGMEDFTCGGLGAGFKF